MNTDMTQGKILPALIRFTIPILIGDLFQQFYNIVDTIIVGRNLGSSALAAVGSGGMLMFLFIGFCASLTAGFGVVTSQEFGAKNMQGVRKSFASGMLLTILVGLAITLLCHLLLRTLLVWMNVPDDIFEDAYSYLAVIFGGMLATTLYNFFAANLRAIGNSRIPLYALLTASGANIALDLFFIVVVKTGVWGAALATVISQAAAALLCGIYILVKGKALQPHGAEWKPEGSLVQRQLVIGIPMALQNVITASGTVIMQSATNTFGSTAVAAVTAATKGRAIFTQPMVSIGVSMASFCGQNYGKGDMKRVKEGVYDAVKLIIVYGIAAGIVNYLILPAELSLFLSSGDSLADLLPWAKTCISINAVFYVPLGFIFCMRSALQGCGKSAFTMLNGVIELAMRLIFAALAIAKHNFIMACACDAGAWCAAGIFCLVSFIIISNRLERSMSHE